MYGVRIRVLASAVQCATGDASARCPTIDVELFKQTPAGTRIPVGSLLERGKALMREGLHPNAQRRKDVSFHDHLGFRVIDGQRFFEDLGYRCRAQIFPNPLVGKAYHQRLIIMQYKTNRHHLPQVCTESYHRIFLMYSPCYTIDTLTKHI